MRILRFVILSVIILFSIITLISLLVPSHIRISKAINIQAEPGKIFGYINDIKKWREWHPAFKNLPLNKIEIIDSTKLKVDQSMITLKIRKLNRVLAEIEVKGKKPITCEWFISEPPAPGVVTLHASMDFRLKWYPWEKFKSLFFEKTYGAQLEEGLINLKELVEAEL